MRAPLGVLFIGVPYYVGALRRDPGFENYPRWFRICDTLSTPISKPGKRTLNGFMQDYITHRFNRRRMLAKEVAITRGLGVWRVLQDPLEES